MRIANPAVDCERNEDSGNDQHKLSDKETDPPVEQAVCQSANYGQLVLFLVDQESVARAVNTMLRSVADARSIEERRHYKRYSGRFWSRAVIFVVIDSTAGKDPQPLIDAAHV